MLNEQEIADMVKDGTLNSTLQCIADRLRKVSSEIKNKETAFEQGDINDHLVAAELRSIRRILDYKAENLKKIQDKFYPNVYETS